MQNDMSNATSKRGIYLTDPKTKEEVCRREYIKKLYVDGSEQYEIPQHNRRAIVNHLKARFDHEVPFQIVFQATAGCDHFIKQTSETVAVQPTKKQKTEAQPTSNN